MQYVLILAGMMRAVSVRNVRKHRARQHQRNKKKQHKNNFSKNVIISGKKCKSIKNIRRKQKKAKISILL